MANYNYLSRNVSLCMHAVSFLVYWAVNQEERKYFIITGNLSTIPSSYYYLFYVPLLKFDNIPKKENMKSSFKSLIFCVTMHCM
jgi:hypothetical protein